MKKKKILFIAPSPLYLEKGSSLRMYGVAKNLATEYNIDMVTYSSGKDFSIKNIKIYRTPKWFKPVLEVGKPSFSKIILDLFILSKAIKLLFTNKYDIIHCEDFEGAFIGYFVSFFELRAKIVYDLHNRILDNLNLKTKTGVLKYPILWIEKLIINRSDLIILNWAKYEGDPIFINKNKFLYYDKINLDIENYSLPAEKYIIYTGNFEPYQGIKEFLRVFKEIDTNVKIVLVGQPNEEIKNFVESNNLKDKVILTGRLTVPQTNYLIKNALFGILPRIEGSSMKLIHYLIWGKLVIAKDTCSNKEIIRTNYNGFLYNTDEELKKKLVTILEKKINTKVNKGIKETKNSIIKVWDIDRFLIEYEK